MLQRLGWSYRDAAGCIVGVAATGAILVNSLYLQSGPHPAPIFDGGPIPAAADDALKRESRQDSDRRHQRWPCGSAASAQRSECRDSGVVEAGHGAAAGTRRIRLRATQADGFDRP